MFSFTTNKKPILEFKCEYDSETNKYKVSGRKGMKKISKHFKADNHPENDYMGISDVETAVKLLNVIEREL